MTRFRKIGALAVAGLVLALAACGGGAEESTGEPLPDEQQNLTFVPNYGWAGTDISKYPLEIGINQAISQTLEPLVKIGPDQQPEPHLAESWEWATPTQLVFTLREGVTFSDGAPFTSADVKGSIERYIAQNAALATVLAPIQSVEATDDLTVTITTSAPTGTLVGVLSMVYIGKGDHATDDEYWAMPIGTGPFVIDEYVANDHFTFSRNDTYWGEKAKLQTLTIKQITDINGKVTALSNGQAQAVNGIPYDQIETVTAMPGVELIQEDSLNYYFVWFHNQHAPLDDPRVRRAMWHALDLQTVSDSLFGDTARVMESFCPTTAFGCVAPTKGFPEYDPDEARRLLEEAGVGDGFTVDVIFSTANATGDPMVQAFISDWQEVGITVEPRGLDPATWLATFTALEWDMDLQPNQTLTGDADYTLFRLYNCAAKRLGYCNPDLDGVLTLAQQSTDPDERLELYQQAVDIMAADAPAIPLFETKVNVATSENVEGLTIPANEFIDFSTVYLTD